jgi:uncharacterized RDD family membrane protein YckC
MNAEQTPCPLCVQTTHMHKAKPLYGHSVCKKCYYGFANRRQLAFFVDVMGWRIIPLPIAFALGFAVGAAMKSIGSSNDAIHAAGQAAGWALATLLLPVFCCKDCFAGQSPGKALCGVKAIDATTGRPCGIGPSFKRNLPLLIPFMPFFVAYQLCNGHRIGDGWSNTKVIWKKYADHPMFSALQKA